MKHRERSWDVVVVGGGHAGCEAAHAAVRMGARTMLVTHRFDRVGEMSCNPAIGGLGKGHLVREIDAMDGLMGRTADRAAIHFRLLNRRKGPAVQGPRAQCDRTVYRKWMQEAVAGSGITVLEAEVADLSTTGARIDGVILADGRRIGTRSVVLTTGTFLNAVIHIGKESQSSGRMGDPAVKRLADRIADFGLPVGRLKTGTPPRILRETIRVDGLEEQHSDADREGLSFLPGEMAGQVSCHITWTNPTTHGIVAENLSSSAAFGGEISSTGPRYCPSLEDKVVRFAEKTAHRVFLEPEGLDSDWVYPNGISMSLPQDVQLRIVRSIAGLERAEIARPGYAVEYDHVDPRGLDDRLAVQGMNGLFLAGQINGTTGYEEAAAQGLAAGLNAATAALEGKPVRFSRSESYIGVLIDDLISRGVSEPYRMFTSRAEYRLSLRADNADQRLTPRGIEIGCVGEQRRTAYLEKMKRIAHARETLGNMPVGSREAEEIGLEPAADGRRRTGLEVMACSRASAEALARFERGITDVDTEAVRQIRRDSIYAPYIERQAREADALRREDARPLEPFFDWSAVRGLSNEIREKLCRVRPESIGQAARIEGMTPAALTLIVAVSRRRKAERA